MKEPTTPFSVFDRLGLDVADENIDHKSNVAATHAVRRVVSTSALYQPSMRSIANILDPLRPLADSASSGIWTQAPLSTQDILISPRPLEATHILVIYTIDPSSTPRPADTQRTVHRRKTPIYPEVMELPINDLLFVLNVPNLLPNSRESFKPILPRRLHKEMPRIMMQVPHLQTFPELVIYLHTKNQAELFRKLIPDWIRDLMHPLPPIPPPSTVSSTTSTENKTTPAPPAPAPCFHPRKLLVMLISASGSKKKTWCWHTLTPALSSVPTSVEPKRSVSSIAAEIGQTALEYASEEAVLHTATLLDGLCDNLSHIGYFGKDLWHELDLSRDILRRAVSYQAKIVYDPGKE